MKTAIITAKIDPEVKASAQKIAKELGVTLSFVINQALAKFAKDKKVVVESYVPNAETIRAIEEGRADYRAGRLAPPVSSVEELRKALENL